MQVNKKGEVENTVYWDDGYKEMQPADLQLRTDGSLVLMCEIVDFDNSDTWRSLIEIDENLNRSYLWSSPIAYNLGVLNNLSTLDENKLALIAPNTIAGLSSEAPFIHFIDGGNSDYARYEFSFEVGVDRRRFTTNIITANNGDLIGIGHYRSQVDLETALIYRVSDEGELLWETTYRAEDWLTGGQLVNELNDIVQLDDGSFVAVGWQEETTDNQSLRDVWLIKVGPDGCLFEEDCDFGQFTTSTKNNTIEGEQSDILFYPNPNMGRLYFSNELKPNSSLELYSSSGEKLIYFTSVNPNTSISINGLYSGMYLLKFISPDNNHQFRKMILR